MEYSSLTLNFSSIPLYKDSNHSKKVKTKNMSERIFTSTTSLKNMGSIVNPTQDIIAANLPEIFLTAI